MNITDALSKATAPIAENCNIFVLDGSMKPDPEKELCRLYPDPLNARFYYLFKRNDVAGEIHEWSKDELAHKGVIGASMYRVPFRVDTEIMTVQMSLQKMGRSIAGSKSSSLVVAESICEYTTGCESGCCSRASEGAPCYCNDCCKG